MPARAPPCTGRATLYGMSDRLRWAEPAHLPDRMLAWLRGQTGGTYHPDNPGTAAGTAPGEPATSGAQSTAEGGSGTIVCMLPKLPGWIVDDAASVREEVAPYVGIGPAELWRITEDCARDAMWAVRASGMADHVLASEDPLPPSTIAALARLRRAKS